MLLQVSVEEQLENLEKEIIQVLLATPLSVAIFTQFPAEVGFECRRQGVRSEDQKTRNVLHL